MQFNQRLRSLRNENRTTQEQLAKYLGVGRPTIAGYETKGKQPSFETLNKIADYFKVSVDYLLGRTDVKEQINEIIEELKNNNISKDETSNEIHNLSPESQEDLIRYLELLKIKDMQNRNSDVEISNDLTAIE